MVNRYLVQIILQRLVSESKSGILQAHIFQHKGVMNFSGPHIAFSILVTLFGYKIAVAALSKAKKQFISPNILFCKLLKQDARKEIISRLPTDFISQLPDDILILIIARVPTKDAVRTSFLSKRWTGLYKSAPNIELSCHCLDGPFRPHDPNTFIEEVDRFLRARSGCKICSFKLTSCLRDSNTDWVEKLICSLGSLGIEKFSLRFLVSSDIFFSFDLISQMPSLTHFDLFHCSLHQMPKLTQFNSLQSLSLTRVTVLGDTLDCILSNCLILDSLRIYLCKVPSKLTFRGPNLRLKNLWVISYGGVEEIEFYSSNLDTFEFKSREVANFRFDHVPKLHKLSLDFINENTMSYVCANLVKDLTHLKCLILSTKGDIYQVSSRTMGNNAFSNLRRLFICLYSAKSVNLLSLAPFLQRCPLLQEFHLNTSFVEFDGRVMDRVDDAVIHSELKQVVIGGHGGTQNEIAFARYILKSAICLERMQITRCLKWHFAWVEWGELDERPWSEHTLRTIHKQLRGQAISDKAKLTIQHQVTNLQTIPW